MKNITVSVDEGTYRRARIRAAELDTSVSALVAGLPADVGRSSGRGRARGVRGGTAGQAAGGGDRENHRERRRVADGPTICPREDLYDEAINGPDAIR